MSKISNLLERNLSSVFNQRDALKRRTALQQLWAADGALWSAEGTFLGRKEIESAAADLARRYPEYNFTPIGLIDEIPGAARMSWAFGAPGAPSALTGMDVAVMADGRITAIYRFLDGAGL